MKKLTETPKKTLKIAQPRGVFGVSAARWLKRGRDIFAPPPGHPLEHDHVLDCDACWADYCRWSRGTRK